MRAYLPISLALAALAAVSCLDPVHSDAVDALGPEASGVRRGPLHRPGQPCLVCHGGDGPGSPDFVVAGTVYDRRTGSTPLSGVSVTLTDKAGTSTTVRTNTAGNFYLTTRELQPVFPLDIELRSGATVKKMETQVGRDGSCAHCHLAAGDSGHVPAVYLAEDAP